MKSVLVLAVVLRACFAQSLHDDGSGFSLVSSVFEKCSNDPDMSSCLKVRAVKLLDRAFDLDSLPVSDFISINKDLSAKDDLFQHQNKTQDLEASLPRDIDQRSHALDKILLDKLQKYIETRTIKLDMPSDVFEGRKKGLKLKKGKGGGMLMMMVGAMGAMLLKLALAKIALIAAKALIVGKVALLLAGVIGLKILVNQGKEEKNSPQVIYAAEPEEHGGWSRSAFIPETAHVLAYRGQRSALPKNVSKSA